MIRTLAFAAALGLAAPAFADHHAEKAEAAAPAQIGPTVGETAPALAALTSEGQTADLASLTGPNGLALVFVRSADWCPYCKTQLKDLEAAAAPLSEAGWSLAAISYDDVKTLSQFKAKEGLSYTLLSDTDSAMIDAFGLRNTEMREGSRYDGIPHPAIVYLRADGSVAAVMREEGYKDRPQVDVVIEAAAMLNEAAG